jgi:glyoxylase-like metal-dependent hydrolase (beta-lactamase superfamily II)
MINQPTGQVSGAYRRRIGEMVVTAISDGYVDASFDMLRAIEARDAEAILHERFMPSPPRINVNCFAVHSGSRVALIDTGAGDTMGPTLGHLGNNLAAAGIRIDDIDTVILTHMHPDHSNGLIDDQGRSCFPEAELVVPELDVKHWHDDAQMAAASERHRIRFFEGARKQIKPYLNRRRDAVGEVFPGVTAHPLPGHTPGHTGYMIESNGESLLIWGDIVHVPEVQTRRPEVTVEPDSDPQKAIETRRQIMEMVASQRLLIAGMHLDFPAFSHLVRRTDGGYLLVPEAWAHDARPGPGH